MLCRPTFNWLVFSVMVGIYGNLNLAWPQVPKMFVKWLLLQCLKGEMGQFDSVGFLFLCSDLLC